MGHCFSHNHQQISTLLGTFHIQIYLLNVENLHHKQSVREVGVLPL